MQHHLLFRIISGIGKDAGIESALYSIAALGHDPVLVGFQKLVIKKYPPLCLHHFAAAVGHESLTGGLSPCVLSDKVFECVWKLQQAWEMEAQA
jgi:hypothetical protein